MPEPARMQIANGLRALRDRSGYTQEQVAERARYGKSTVSRYEDPFSAHKIVARTVRLLAEASGATSAEAAALVRLAEGGQPQWWADDAVAPSLHPLLNLEQTADAECVMAPWLVPGLLQTAGYARAVHHAEHPRRDDASIRRMVDARMERQQVLTTRDGLPPLHLWAILHETVLRSVVGDRDVMAGQIAHLIEAAQRPNVDIQLIKFDSGASAAGAGHFVTLEAGTKAAVYVELLGGGVYVSNPVEVESYKTTFDYLRSQALSTDRSLGILRSVHEEYAT
ncbi:helix-turn-helix domain-containing protein [Streptomyces sp. NPDC090442]|uniref:helix-turn-helix domain-containing protein n=1 Tax=Streptomyces sp. NPDC090442 TaxID=3365962 RepID=UPI0038119591